MVIKLGLLRMPVWVRAVLQVLFSAVEILPGEAGKEFLLRCCDVHQGLQAVWLSWALKTSVESLFPWGAAKRPI